MLVAISEMKLTLTEKIEKVTEMPQEQVLATLRNGNSAKFQLFPDHIMYGNIREDTIDALINPPLGWVDVIRSRVTGQVRFENKLTTIHLIVKPSWIMIGCTVIWCGLLIMMTFSFNYPNLLETLKFMGITFIWAFIPFGLSRLKVNWDKRRLENWLNKNIKTVPTKDATTSLG